MKTNVGSNDRVLRTLIGIGLLSLLFIVQGSSRWLGLIGLIPLFTALGRWCPLYTLLGINSCSRSVSK